MSVTKSPRILDACPDWTWKLLVGLARYAGLRTPSESLAVQWSNIDWEAHTLRVYGQKTDRERVVPLRSELFNLLMAGRLELGGSGRIVDRSTNNLQRDLRVIMDHAGIAAAANVRKPFQAFRASCENDWKEQGVAEPTYAAWLGHSVNVSRRHYVSPTSSEVERVTGVLQKCMQSTQESPRNNAHGEAHKTAAKKGAKVMSRYGRGLRDTSRDGSIAQRLEQRTGDLQVSVG